MKSTHNEEPRIYWDRDGETWRLDHRLSVKVGEINIVVPEGYATDLASVPAIFQPIVAVYGAYNRASCVHDFLYQNHGVLVEGKKLTREQCDRIFFDLMVSDGVSVWQAVVMWGAVRANPFNFPPFKKW